MAGPRSLLDEAIESWVFARRGVVAEAEVVPPERYDFAPAEGARSVRELLLHVVTYGLIMVGELSRPDGDFRRQRPADFEREYGAGLPATPGAEELKDLLTSTLEVGVARLRSVGEVGMMQEIRRFDGERWTRLAWMHHAIAHEEYHRGQLALYVRCLGLVPALTRRIHRTSS